ncbi:hypothetical protein ASN18_3018 [Candidatus Magnetominusculus xianensis]|uniref:Uncharacterized protein n=1 Tax=Candidatus Magnetominusculus xianensis TaxID=1748249 RepID=A0ABR5SBR2_9BACT|nr:hypothetical protein ASN18_3018 [Candidatus Magnetominusculus xianensis]
MSRCKSTADNLEPSDEIALRTTLSFKNILCHCGWVFDGRVPVITRAITFQYILASNRSIVFHTHRNRLNPLFRFDTTASMALLHFFSRVSVFLLIHPLPCPTALFYNCCKFALSLHCRASNQKDCHPVPDLRLLLSVARFTLWLNSTSRLPLTMMFVWVSYYSECQNKIPKDVVFMTCPGLFVRSRIASSRRAMSFSTLRQWTLLNQRCFRSNHIFSIGLKSGE